MKQVRLERVQKLASQMKGDPRSVFYGDVTVSIDPEHAQDAIGHQEAPEDVTSQAIVASDQNDASAAAKVAAYNAMSGTDRASRTLLPPLACWNAMVIVNPMLGKVLATALDYMLLKTLNDYPYEGKAIPVFPVGDSEPGVARLVIDSSTISGKSGTPAHRYIAVPFFRFVIAASTLNAAPGSQISIDIRGKNAEGAEIDTAREGGPKYTYAFQRISSTEAVVGIYIPTTVVSTRTLPFLPIAGDRTPSGKTELEGPESITITFRGVASTDQITVVIPGYSTAELKEISTMYNLPSGMIR